MLFYSLLARLPFGLVLEDLNGKQFPTLTDNFPPQRLTVPNLLVQTTRFTLRTCFVMLVVCLAPSKFWALSPQWASLVATQHTSYNVIKGIMWLHWERTLLTSDSFSPEFLQCLSFSWFCFPASLCNKSQLWVWLYTKSHESSRQLWIVELVMGTLKPKSYRSFLP